MNTDHNAAVIPARQAGANQAGHKVCRRGAVVPADTRGEAATAA